MRAGLGRGGRARQGGEAGCSAPDVRMLRTRDAAHGGALVLEEGVHKRRCKARRQRILVSLQGWSWPGLGVWCCTVPMPEQKEVDEESCSGGAGLTSTSASPHRGPALLFIARS